ncbi:MAG: hypothetical protein FJ109_10265 [Deltaproteobacteria bacterium]|nr:hypothetical protein [Deltaproteobacteria bacterium]
MKAIVAVACVVVLLGACGDEGPVFPRCADPLGSVLIRLVNVSQQTLYLEGIDEPVKIYRQDGSNWKKVIREHGCASACHDCQNYSCGHLWCEPPRGLEPGEKYETTWTGLSFSKSESLCTDSEGDQLSCLEEHCAEAGRYKLSFCTKVQPWPESDDEAGPMGECLDEAPLLGVEPIPDVCAEVEFDFPKSDGPLIVVELSGR